MGQNIRVMQRAISSLQDDVSDLLQPIVGHEDEEMGEGRHDDENRDGSDDYSDAARDADDFAFGHGGRRERSGSNDGGSASGHGGSDDGDGDGDGNLGADDMGESRRNYSLPQRQG
ncbi:hypothetical protein RHMOL_Rhmol07G0236900 [Rhododendron molle]|uniref:Uncharacterized protein n=1 Tax=Rhododendron molle TaxID=49168 RepID=A0ACC0N3Y8_RHOML|nr:hypothetical protein RHMOL_Rhmol07G0236900 [Rhododendron molle]